MKISYVTIAFCLVASPLVAQTADSVRTPPFFNQRDAFIAAGFTAAIIAMAPLDKKMAHSLQDSALQESVIMRRGAAFFQFMGQPAPQLIGVGLYGVGKIAHNAHIQKLGLHGLEAMFLSTAVTSTIKVTVGRARPYVHRDSAAYDVAIFRGFKGRDYQSFPSGHATTAFAVASSVTSEARQWIGEGGSDALKLGIGVVMYGGATLIGVSRVYHDQHWATDVIAGAAIGTFSGLKTVAYNYRHPKNVIERALISANVVPTLNGETYIAWSIPVGK